MLSLAANRETNLKDDAKAIGVQSARQIVGKRPVAFLAKRFR